MKKIIVSLFALSFIVVSSSAFFASAQTGGRVMLNYSEDANVGKSFVLDGSKSQDDETVKTFTWTQVDGPKVSFSDAHAAKPTFTPTVAGTYVFELTVIDNNGLSLTAQKVTVYAKGESETETKTETNTDASTERVLPTVNKVEDEDEDEDSSSERVLPTVNKKTGAEVSVRGWDDKQKEAIQKAIETEVENDAAIRLVEITKETVVIDYATPAKLFGIFNINMNLHIASDAEGKVKVRFPWYSLLVKTEFAKTGEKLDYIFQNNETDFEFLKAKGSAGAQVEIFETISKAMHDMAKSIIQNIRA